MAGPTPRAFLFHGPDSRASAQALARWRSVFLGKFGETTLYVLEADELSADGFAEHFGKSLRVQTLFPEPRLIVVKRLTSQEKAGGGAYTKRFLEDMDAALGGLGAETTVALWEPRALSVTHPLARRFQEWQDEGRAKVQHFALPEGRGVVRLANAYLGRYDQYLSTEAESWLVSQYRRLEKQMRLARRLKAREELVEDERGWWLAQLLESASLNAAQEVGLADLEAGQATLEDPVGPFEFGGAVAAGRWEQARYLLSRILQDNEEGELFGLVAALRWQLERQPGSLTAERARYGLRLLAEAEIVAKNSTAGLSWLLTLWLLRLEAVTRAQQPSLLEPRRLWLAQRGRS